MLKKLFVASFIFISVISLFTGCKNKKTASEIPKTEKAGENIVNPMVKSDYEELKKTFGVNFKNPENSASPTYYIIGGTLAEMDFGYIGGIECTARFKKAEKREDISGMYYDWKNTEKISVSGCDGEVMLTRSDEKDIQVALWYDKYSGFSYSLSVMAKNLDGFDITALAEDFYIPAN